MLEQQTENDKRVCSSGGNTDLCVISFSAKELCLVDTLGVTRTSRRESRASSDVSCLFLGFRPKSRSSVRSSNLRSSVGVRGRRKTRRKRSCGNGPWTIIGMPTSGGQATASCGHVADSRRA